MAKNPTTRGADDGASGADLTSSIDEMLLAARARGDETLQTGRYIMTFSEGTFTQGVKSMDAFGMRTADARDFKDQAVTAEDVGDAEALVLPEIGVVLISAAAYQERTTSLHEAAVGDGPMQTVEPEFFVFADSINADFMLGFQNAAAAIAAQIQNPTAVPPLQPASTAEAVNATWGLIASAVPPCQRGGLGIRVAVLDTGVDLGHPDFTGRQIFTQTFVGQPVQDLNGHGTHCIGTACGPLAAPGTTPRYGIAHEATIYAGKVLTNAGTGTSASVLAGMNWAIANNCEVISMSLGSQAPVQAAYTAAGQAALSKGCLIIAAAGNAASPTGAPANSPTILSVASLDQNLTPSGFSSFGKVEVAAPGQNIFSSVPMPARYGIKSGTSMATPHVAGCAALWAQSAPALRGSALWNQLLARALPLAYPPAHIGSGIVQA